MELYLTRIVIVTAAALERGGRGSLIVRFVPQTHLGTILPTGRSKSLTELGGDDEHRGSGLGVGWVGEGEAAAARAPRR